MNSEIRKTPTSWYIWIALWVLPMFLMFRVYQEDPETAIFTWIGTGVLILLMFFKTKWVLPWFCVILMFDLFGYGVMITEQGANIGQIFGSLLKELIFLGYLLFSKNAKAHQGRVTAPESTPANEILQGACSDANYAALRLRRTARSLAPTPNNRSIIETSKHIH